MDRDTRVLTRHGTHTRLACPVRAASQFRSDGQKMVYQLTSEDWAGLREAMLGDVITPQDEEYDAAILLADTEFRHTAPLAVARCHDAQDVARVVDFSRVHNVNLTPRSGGHSFAGFSTGRGIVVDLAAMTQIELSDGMVYVQPGVTLAQLSWALQPVGLAVPTGWCPTVAVGGLCLGGGLGIDSRLYGLAIDRLVSIDAVLMDGSSVTCDGESHADLFWALRGVGGGNIAIATGFRFRPVPAESLTTWRFEWPWEDAAEVVARWQQWAPSSPPQLTPVLSVELLDAGQDEVPVVALQVAWSTRSEEAQTAVSDFLASVTAPPSQSTHVTEGFHDGMLRWFGCQGMTMAECRLESPAGGGILPRVGFARARGHLFESEIGEEGIENVLRCFTADRRSDESRILEFLAFGGAINEVDPSETAFVHRSALFYAGVSVGMMSEVSAERAVAASEWIDVCWESVRPWASGRTYQNFIDPDLTDWRQQYYGTNVTRLEEIRRAYDVDRQMLFPQSL